MGIHDLLPFLRKAGAVSSPVWSAVPQGARAAVDVPIFMHKFLYSERAFEGIALRFVRLAETIQSRGLQPTFVFDGPKLHLKGEERKRRAAAANAQMERFRLKRSAQVEKAMEHPEEYFMVALESPVNEGPLWPTSKDYDDLWHSLKAHGLDVSRAKHEAEALCAHLVLTGDAWCSITEDTDSVAFGCPRTIFKFLAPEPELVEAHTVYAKLKLSSEALLDFCMMCGSDFTDRIHLVGPVKALGLMQKWGSWSGVYENCRPGWSGKTADSADVFRDVYPVMQDMFASCCYESRAEPDKKDGVAPLPTDASGGVDATAGPQWEAGHAEASNSFHDETPLQETSSQKSPLQDTSSQKTPLQETSSLKSPPQKTVTETPSQQLSECVLVHLPAIVPDPGAVAPLEFEPLVSNADLRQAILAAYANGGVNDEIAAEQDAAYFIGVCTDMRRLKMPNENMMRDSIVKEMLERSPQLESIILAYVFQ